MSLAMDSQDYRRQVETPVMAVVHLRLSRKRKLSWQVSGIAAKIKWAQP